MLAIRLTTALLSLANDDSGATAIEYGLIAAMLSISLIGAAILLGENLVALWDYVATNLIAAWTRN